MHSKARKINIAKLIFNDAGSSPNNRVVAMSASTAPEATSFINWLDPPADRMSCFGSFQNETPRFDISPMMAATPRLA